MVYIFSYDVETTTPDGRRRLRRVARACENHGIRVQRSVFECTLSSEVYVAFKAQLVELIDESKDSLRIYPLGSNSRSKAVHIGVRPVPDLEAPLIL